jgi:hypothetical protein
MKKRTDLPETKLIIPQRLPQHCSQDNIIRKVNEIITALNFLDEHVNFLYERSRTQYNTLVSTQQGMQSMYDEFQLFKARFDTFDLRAAKQKELEPSSTSLDLLEHQVNN